MSQTLDTAMKYGSKKKSLKAYMLGLILSLIFTVISFSVVGHHLFSEKMIFILLTVMALLQLLAQVVCFLGMNLSEKGRMNSMPFIFTLLVVGVLVFGSLWIMYNLNYNMMH